MTSDRKLGRISACEIKEGWSKETEFSDWLAEPENLQVLCDALGIELIDDVERESPVGPYRADIVGTMSDGRLVIIENQWGTTDHEHLGKIITYASGKDASVIIWIAERYDDEHSSAIEWLNNISNDTWFFLAIIKLIRIDESKSAPLFNVIQRPNNYIQMQNSALSDTDRIRYEFWRGLVTYSAGSKALREALPGIDNRTPTSDNWFAFKRGFHGFEINLLVSVRSQQKQSVAVRVWISDDKDLYGLLQRYKDEIEHELGSGLDWHSDNEKKASSVTLRHMLRKGETDDDCYRWFEDAVPRMTRTFDLYARKYGEEGI